jgi:hypothetical protein
MLGLPNYLYRLIPANPILLRVVENGGKRRRDLFIRCAYLGLLILVVLFSLYSKNVSDASLAELAKTSANVFQSLSYFQLGLVALLAPVFTAGSITQERDSQTYDILLSTPLSNGQIVLGSLLSRLFFIVILLISGIPIFSITQIFGGVATSSIFTSFAIAAAPRLSPARSPWRSPPSRSAAGEPSSGSTFSSWVISWAWLCWIKSRGSTPSSNSTPTPLIRTS